MAKLSSLMWIFLAFYLTHNEVFCDSSSSNLFERILDDGEPCKESCDKTYPLHTYPNPKHSECCKRGCRFYSLVEFINKTAGENATRDACMASCIEAYLQTADRYACNIGCSNQVPFKSPSLSTQSDQGSETDDSMTDSFDMPIFRPFMIMNSMYKDMWDRMSKVVSFTWSFYMQQSDGQLVIIQSDPKILTEFIDIGPDDNINDDGDEKDDQMIIRPNLDEKESDKVPHSDIVFYHKQIVPSGDVSDEMPVRITVNAYTSEEVKSLDWLGCVSKKSGLPRWLLGFVIFVSAMVMVWLCFATTASAPEQHVKSQGLSIYGDGECVQIDKNGYNVRQYYDKNSDEAEALPIKVHLPSV